MSKRDFFGTKIEIMDTTLRDGEQTPGVSFTPREKLHIARTLLGQLGLDRIEVTSAKTSEGEKESLQQITNWALDNGYLDKVEVLAFIDNNFESVDWIVEAGGRVVNFLAKGSYKHCKGQLKKELQEHLFDIARNVKYAKEKGCSINIYLEDWSNGYVDSPDYVFDLMDGLIELEIDRFMLPDTLGVMMPEEVKESIANMVARYPAVHFDFHPHNDYGLATANILAAAQTGVRGVHSTVNCLGERAGNASLAEVIVALKDKLNITLSIDEKKILKLQDVCELVETFSGRRNGASSPIIGEDVFTQTCGVHADGDKKGDLYRNPIYPERFGRVRSYALHKLSGKANIEYNLAELGIELSAENLEKVKNRIKVLGERKEQILNSDLPFIIKDVLESGASERIKLLNCSINSGKDLKATASIAIEVDGKFYSATGQGNGGYDAFMHAVGKVLKEEGLLFPKLTDYEVIIPKGGGTSAITQTVISWEQEVTRIENGKKIKEVKNIKTVGVDTDQVMAAVSATLKFLELRMMEKNGV